MRGRTTIAGVATFQTILTAVLATAGVRHLYAVCIAALFAGALLAVTDRPERKYLKNTLLATWGGLVITMGLTIAHAAYYSTSAAPTADVAFIAFGMAFVDTVLAAFPAYFAALVGGRLVFHHDRILDRVIPGAVGRQFQSQDRGPGGCRTAVPVPGSGTPEADDCRGPGVAVSVDPCDG